MAEEGTRALAKGWAPTFFGYSMQGVGKFGFYEAFKILYGNMLGEVFYFKDTVLPVNTFTNHFHEKNSLHLMP